MTLQQLHYVVALAETGSFTAAAEVCHVTQPTLSAQVKALEDGWGTRLFDRSVQPVRPTAVGERVAAEARAALDRLQALEQAVRLGRSEVGGTLEIGVIPTLAPYLLPRVLPAVREKLPRLNLRITEALTGETVEKVRRGRWDLGLVSTPSGFEGLDERPLFREAFRAYLPPGHPLLSLNRVPLGWLDEAGLLLLREGHCLRSQVLSLCGSDRRPEAPVSFESGSLDTLLRMVDAGQGTTLVPEGLTLELDGDRRLQVRVLEDPEPFRTVGAVLAPDAPKAALTAAFLEAVREALPSRWRITPP